jgi:hypothetical protein
VNEIDSLPDDRATTSIPSDREGLRAGPIFVLDDYGAAIQRGGQLVMASRGGYSDVALPCNPRIAGAASALFPTGFHPHPSRQGRCRISQ